MEQQHVGIRNVLDVKQFDFRVGFGIKILVHIHENVLDANLLAIADRPDAIELQTLDDSTFEDENCRSTRSTNEIDTVGIQLGNGLGEDGVMITIQQADAVGADESGTILLTNIEDFLFENGTLMRFFAEPRRYNNERARMLLLGHQLYVVGTVLRRHHEDSQIRRGQFTGIMEHFNALHLVLLGIHDTQRALIAAAQ